MRSTRGRTQVHSLNQALVQLVSSLELSTLLSLLDEVLIRLSYLSPDFAVLPLPRLTTSAWSPSCLSTAPTRTLWAPSSRTLTTRSSMAKTKSPKEPKDMERRRFPRSVMAQPLASALCIVNLTHASRPAPLHLYFYHQHTTYVLAPFRPLPDVVENCVLSPSTVRIDVVQKLQSERC